MPARRREMMRPRANLRRCAILQVPTLNLLRSVAPTSPVRWATRSPTLCHPFIVPATPSHP